MKKITTLFMLLILGCMTTFAQEVVVPPSELQTEPYNLKFTDPRDRVTYTKEVNVGFIGNDVYIQGFSDFLNDSWVKGTLEGNTLTIPETFLGEYIIPYSDPYPMTFSESTFTFDSGTGIFTSAMGFQTVSKNQTLDWFMNITMKRIVEMAATPATPSCKFVKSSFGTMYILEMNVPIVDVNDNPMLSGKLSYMVFVELNNSEEDPKPITFTPDLYTRLTEPMTEIPYTFTDRYDIDNYQIYINHGEDVFKTWKRIGVQSIYRGGGEEHKSEIGWFDMAIYWEPVGIQGVVTHEAKPSVIYNFSGQRMSQPKKGLNIINGRKVVIK